MVYRSKIGLELVITLVIVLGGCTGLMIYDGVWQGLFVMIPSIGFVTHLFFTTYYVIEGSTLNIRCGFSRQQVAIASIRKIDDGMNWMSAPALSTDRLELYLQGYNSVVISPKDKKGFIRHLLTIKPDIELKLNKITLTE